jgi:hypothetical protein
VAESQVNIRVGVKGASQLDKLGRLINAVDRAARNALGTVPKAANSIRAFGTSAAAASGGVTTLGAAITAALGPIATITGAIALLGKSFAKAGERQADLLVLEKGLQKFGVAGSQAIDDVIAKANEFGNLTLFTQEDYIKSANILTSFTSIAVSEYERVIGVAGDVAQVVGTDVTSATTQLAKALQEPTTGLTALSRSGIQFSEQQKTLIKSLVESGNQLEAQNLILSEIEKQYGGAAIAAGSEGLAGKIDLLGENFNDLFESIGKALEPLAGPLIDGAAAAVEGFSVIVQSFGQFWQFISDNIFPKFVEALRPVYDTLRDVFEGIDFETIKNIIENTLIRGFEVTAEVIGAAARAFQRLVDFIKASPLAAAINVAVKSAGFLADKFGFTKDTVAQYNKELDAGRTDLDAQKQAAADLANEARLRSEAEAQVALELQKSTEAAVEQSKYSQALLQSEIQIAQAKGDQATASESQIQLNNEVARQRIAEISLQQQTGKLTEEQAEQQETIALLTARTANTVAEIAEQRRQESAALKQLREVTEFIDRAEKNRLAIVDQQLSVTQARAAAETAVNDVLLQQLNRQLDGAKTQEERKSLAQQIYNLTVAQAQIELQAAREQIAANTEKQRIETQAAILKEKQVELAVQLAIAEKRYTAELAKAYDIAVETRLLAQRQLETTIEVGRYQNTVADATFSAKVEAAEFARNMASAEKNTSGTADQMDRLAESTNRAGNLAGLLKTRFGEAANNVLFSAAYAADFNEYTKKGINLQGEFNKLQEKYLRISSKINEEIYKGKVLSAQQQLADLGISEALINQLTATVRNRNSALGGFNVPFAEGGYVTRPTRALIGEGGESEYVIPSSKMDAAMRNYSAGRRGDAVLNMATPQINLTTGPVMQMNGTDYVTKADMTRAMSSAVNQTIQTITSTPALRRRMGVAR